MIESKLWVDFATMHFKGNASLWLQKYEALHSIDNWAALCVGVFTKLNSDKYGKIIDIFFALRQTVSVDEYALKFEEFMHKVMLHNHAYDDTFFVRRVIAGLKREIRSAIKLHNSSTVVLAFFHGSNAGCSIDRGLSNSTKQICAEICITPKI
jgi:hypothetical protein